MMAFLLWIFKILSISVLVTDIDCLRDVVVTIEPAIVEKSHSCTLRCAYDLESSFLYSVKWYYGGNEFYRYSPKYTPYTKIFPIPGIDVDESQSNGTQVVLRNVGLGSSGRFICEVSTEAPEFATARDQQDMQVVQLPEDAPQISLNMDSLESENRLSASCLSSSSQPPASLKFVLNNRTVARSDPYFIKQNADTALWSGLSLNITLGETDFIDGLLILGCEARIEGIYYRYAEVKWNMSKDTVAEKDCQIGDTVIEAGKRKYIPGKCLEVSCGRDGATMTGKSCPNYDSRFADKSSEIDYTKPYPDCCSNKATEGI